LIIGISQGWIKLYY